MIYTRLVIIKEASTHDDPLARAIVDWLKGGPHPPSDSYSPMGDNIIFLNDSGKKIPDSSIPQKKTIVKSPQ